MSRKLQVNGSPAMIAGMNRVADRAFASMRTPGAIEGWKLYEAAPRKVQRRVDDLTPADALPILRRMGVHLQGSGVNCARGTTRQRSSKSRGAARRSSARSGDSNSDDGGGEPEPHPVALPAHASAELQRLLDRIARRVLADQLGGAA